MHLTFCSVHALPLPPTEDHAWAGEPFHPSIVFVWSRISSSQCTPFCLPISLLLCFANTCLPSSKYLNVILPVYTCTFIFPFWLCLYIFPIFVSQCYPSSLHLHSLHSPASHSHCPLPPSACLPPVDNGDISRHDIQHCCFPFSYIISSPGGVVVHDRRSAVHHLRLLPGQLLLAPPLLLYLLHILLTIDYLGYKTSQVNFYEPLLSSPSYPRSTGLAMASFHTGVFLIFNSLLALCTQSRWIMAG